MTVHDEHLSMCLEYNPQAGFVLEDVVEILAAVAGPHDCREWHWILRLADGRFVYLTGSYDEPGWDSQSGARSQFAATPEMAALYARASEPDRSGQKDMERVRYQLLQQLPMGKVQAWREILWTQTDRLRAAETLLDMLTDAVLDLQDRVADLKAAQLEAERRWWRDWRG